MSMKAEIGVMHLQTEEEERFPGKPQKVGKGHGINCPS